MIGRRRFLENMGVVGAASLAWARLPEHAASAEATPPPNAKTRARTKTWLFWDHWHFDRFEGLELTQAQAVWRPEGTYVDPLMHGHNTWPTVYRDPQSGLWRMLYSARWKPYTLMLAESADGIRWKPASQPDVMPPGKRPAANHLFTLEGGSAGGVYLDPVAADGKPFKVFAHQQEEPVYRRALADPNHPWHAVAKAEGSKRYMTEELLLHSADGLRWEIAPDARWGRPDWHPEPPLFGFYHQGLRRHAMTVRPGWGDRRVCLQTSADCKNWSGPELLFQPDMLDPCLVQHYGMPVFPYDCYYVGLLWIFHTTDTEPLRGFNQFFGPIDCQLAYSYDGLRFTRGLRRPLIARNAPGEPGSAVVQPACLVETPDEIRIYSGSGKVPHGMSSRAVETGERNVFAVVLHTLRKDGFTYLKPTGDAGRFLSKPLALTAPTMTLNAEALHGEVRFQVTDLESRPVEGYTFDDCVPVQAVDRLTHPLEWKEKRLDDLQNRVIRLEFRLRNARLYSLRGDYHFLDAQDRRLLDDGKAIDTARFDF